MSRVTFEAAVSALGVNLWGEDESWVYGSFSAGGTTCTVTWFFYDAAGVFIGTRVVTIDATTLTDGTRFLSNLAVTANPGASSARIHVTTLSGGTVTLFAGSRQGTPGV